MKKIILAGTIALSLSTSLLAEASDMDVSTSTAHWYVGAEYSTGSGTRTYEYNDVDFDSSGITLKVGHIQKDFDKIEFQYTAKTLENQVNSSDSDDVAEYKINFVTSIMRISYKEIVIPYVEVGIGYGDSENYGGQLATHLGLGIMVNPINQVELTVGYRLSTSIGSDNNDNSYADQHGDMVIGAAYKF